MFRESPDNHFATDCPYIYRESPRFVLALICLHRSIRSIIMSLISLLNSLWISRQSPLILLFKINLLHHEEFLTNTPIRGKLSYIPSAMVCVSLSMGKNIPSYPSKRSGHCVKVTYFLCNIPLSWSDHTDR